MQSIKYFALMKHFIQQMRILKYKILVEFLDVDADSPSVLDDLNIVLKLVLLVVPHFVEAEQIANEVSIACNSITIFPLHATFADEVNVLIMVVCLEAHLVGDGVADTIEQLLLCECQLRNECVLLDARQMLDIQ